MAEDCIQLLDALCALLRKHGVTHYEGPLHATATVRLTLSSESRPEKAPAEDNRHEFEVCRCGHQQWEHGNDGLCHAGCEVERCAPEGDS